jgi:VanZ family protein
MLNQLSGILDHTCARLPMRSVAYGWLFLGWAVTLWFLSAANPSLDKAPEIPHIDKVLHFSYFLAGGALLAAYAGLKWPMVSRGRLFWVVTMLCCVIGRLDEYHQGFVQGRSGNDSGDWLADTLGGMAGVFLVIRLFLPRITDHRQDRPKRGANRHD